MRIQSLGESRKNRKGSGRGQRRTDEDPSLQREQRSYPTKQRGGGQVF